MVDYNKWKSIEISDDEDETHPNIDTPSLFRWRHNARIERMEQQRKEKEEFEKRKQVYQKNYAEIREKLDKINLEGKTDKELENKLKNLEKEGEEIQLIEKELKKKEELTPWNVDTISRPGFSKTVVNVPKPRVEENLTDEEKERRFKKFIKDNESIIKQYGMLRKFDDSKRFLMDYPHLACDETANYLVLWCINLEMEEKHNLMVHVAHQTICMQYILHLAKELDVDPKTCISTFFSKIQIADTDYKQEFNKEVDGLVERVTKRAQEKLDAALKEIEEEERAKRLGPGGLDPFEVMESLPEELKVCFETQNVELLQETISKMDPEEASYHMKRCVDSGLWVPDAKNSFDSSSNQDTSSSAQK